MESRENTPGRGGTAIEDVFKSMDVRAVRRSLCRDPESIQEEHIHSLERQAGALHAGLHMGHGFHF